MDLGPFAGLIYTVILLVDCIFFLFLEWWMPRVDLHFVHHQWNPDVYAEVCLSYCVSFLFYVLTFDELVEKEKRDLETPTATELVPEGEIHLLGMYHAMKCYIKIKSDDHVMKMVAI